MKIDFQQQLKSLPSPIARAIAKDTYSKGDSRFSVTQLLTPPQSSYLATRGERIIESAMGIASLHGQAIHKILEENIDPEAGEFAERRFFAIIEGVKVSGQVDFYQPSVIYDYKNVIGEKLDANPEHVLQAQMNSYLASFNGVEVNMAGVTYFQKDWKESSAWQNPKYPQSAIKKFVFDYDPEVAIESFKLRISEHKLAEEGSPRLCTRNEKWQKPQVWAVMNKNAARASKLCSTYAEAEEIKKPGQVIQHRAGVRTRCESYCGYKHICPQYRQESMEMANTNDDF